MDGPSEPCQNVIQATRSYADARGNVGIGGLAIADDPELRRCPDDRSLLATVLRHLGLTRMLAGMIETAFGPGGLADIAERGSLARRAKQIEEKGDRLTVIAREIFARVRNAEELLTLIDQVENATDCSTASWSKWRTSCSTFLRQTRRRSRGCRGGHSGLTYKARAMPTQTA